MKYRAILKCRECAGNHGRSTTNTTVFSHDSDGNYPPSLANAQDAIEKYCRLSCDKCHDNDWRVIEVQPVHARGH